MVAGRPSDRYEHQLDQHLKLAEWYVKDLLADRELARARAGLDTGLSPEGCDSVLQAYKNDVKQAFEKVYGSPGSGWAPSQAARADFEAELEQLAQGLPERFERQAASEQPKPAGATESP